MMEIIMWASRQGQTIKFEEREEAKELRYLIDKALKEGNAESGFINTKVEVPIQDKEGGKND